MTYTTDDESATAADLGVGVKTVRRFKRELPNFPQPVQIRGRDYYYARQIRKWKREQLERVTS
jgi:hypothetical protein